MAQVNSLAVSVYADAQKPSKSITHSVQSHLPVQMPKQYAQMYTGQVLIVLRDMKQGNAM